MKLTIDVCNDCGVPISKDGDYCYLCRERKKKDDEYFKKLKEEK